MSPSLIEHHGSAFVNLLTHGEHLESLRHETVPLPSWTLNDRQICDLELLLNGGFSPLNGFLTRNDYDTVCSSLRLSDGTLWPIPITLDISAEAAADLSAGDRLTLRDKEGFALAVLTVGEVWQPDLENEARLVYGTADDFHPGVNYLFNFSQPFYVGGTLEGISLPKHYDHQPLRHTPRELRDQFQKRGWEDVVAFQTRNPMHRAHVELTLRAASEAGADLLIHPVVGLTKPGDVDHYTRVRCYQRVLEKYPTGTAMLSLLPLAMRLAGPREALWHGIIRKNYGCNHLIVGRDHASPGVDSQGQLFYDPYQAQELFQQHATELGIRMVPFKRMVYVEERAEYHPEDEVADGARILTLTGTELRRRFDKGLDIPAWFSYPEVVEELRLAKPALRERGFTVFFTGLSGAGKSTLAKGLLIKLLEDARRPVTLLDGDIVRTHLSSELGFSKEHRSINVRRIGFVASEITKNRGIALCAPIAPYRIDRRFNRELISAYGGFVEVYVNTPLEVCEQRDVKGLYAQARKGLIKQVTGIDDPYEPPQNPEIVIDSSQTDPEILVQDILLKIEHLGFL